MKLQILIPQYKETNEVIKPLLDSIAIQQNVDLNEIGVIITNDGTEIKLSKELLNSYPFKIEYYSNEHKGVSATRNYCLDHAVAPYVMFCDADDMFFDVRGLNIIFQEIDKGFQVLMSHFLEESRDQNGNPAYVEHKQDATFVHGKVFNRQFLIDNNIRWNEKLTVHEDSYFNYLSQICTTEGQLKLCSTPFYMWKWNDSSVSRHDKKYILKTYNNMIDSTDELIKQLIQRGKADKAREIANNLIYDCYFLMNKDEWQNEENKEYFDATAARIKRFYLDYEFLIKTLNEETRKRIIINLRNKKYNEGLIMESISFREWLVIIMEH